MKKITTDNIEAALELIAKDQLPAVIDLLQETLKGGPAKEELVLLAARLADLNQQIRQGIIEPGQADLTKNRIRMGFLALVSEKRMQGIEGRSRKDENAHSDTLSDVGVATLYGNIQISGEIVAGRDIQLGGHRAEKKKRIFGLW